MTKTIWVSLPYATFSIDVEGGKVIDAAPIAKWMVGNNTQMVRQWIKNRNGYWKVLGQEEE